MPHDFFLSYASQDNEAVIPGRETSQWVSTFHEVLRNRLQYYLSRKAEVFFDRRDLNGNSALTPEIEAALDDSRLFIAISSPTYYRRPWCKLERSRFIKRLGSNPAMAKRVFIIQTTNVDPLIHPNSWQAEFFPDIRGYQFFREEKDGRVLTLGSPALDQKIGDADSYYIEIERLAQDMAARIRELEAQAAPEAAMETPKEAEGDAVFLAENAFRSHAEREELRAALGEAGFEVRPAASLAAKPAEALAASLGGALAFIQIVSPVLLEIPGRGSMTYDHEQLAAARAAGLPAFRWRAPDLDVAASSLNFPGFRDFAVAPDVGQQLLPTFKQDLLTALRDLRAAQRVKQSVQGDERLVLITGEPSDLASHAEAVARQLDQRAIGHYITESPAEELEAEDVRGFLVLYGGSKAEWVRDKLRIVRTLPKTRLRGLRVGVYFCEPPPDIIGERRLLFDMPSFNKIHWNDPPSFEAFASAVAL